MNLSHPSFTANDHAQLRLARTPGVGMATYRRLIARCGSANAAIAQWEDLFKGKRPLAEEALLQKELTALTQLGGQLLLWGDTTHYPAALAELPDAPLVLSVLGNLAILQQRQVAVVGNRTASAHGLGWTRTLAQQLAEHGLIVTSGLARGIDTAAHEGALHSLKGGTVAVVAGGIDHIYPPENAALRQQILTCGRGCLVSEQPLGSAPTAQLFPRRNRIIAGLSIGVLVAEASKKSGSLITADCALGYGRDVWAVPGTPGDVRASGPNHLLRQGAQLVEDATDILRGLPARPAPYVAPAKPPSTPDLFATEALPDTSDDELTPPAEQTPRQHIWALLGARGVGFDDLLRQAAFPPTTLQSVLTDLELDGLATRDALGNWQRL